MKPSLIELQSSHRVASGRNNELMRDQLATAINVLYDRPALERRDSIYVPTDRLDLYDDLQDALSKQSDVLHTLRRVRDKFPEGARQYRAIHKLINDIEAASGNIQTVFILNNEGVSGGVMSPAQYKMEVDRVTNPGSDELGWYR